MILQHLQSRDYSFTNQWGFQAGKSTSLALLSTIHDWHLHLENSMEVCATFLDLRKTFDSVPHRQLMEVLSNLGLPSSVLKWLVSYLTDRKQRVVVNGCTSHESVVLSGVPQGSVLGPLLFLLYINSIQDLKLSAGTRMMLYADDILLYKPIHSVTDYQQYQSDINTVSIWLKHRHLSINPAKCKYMVVTRKRFSLVQTFPPILIESTPIDQVSEMKYLGVTITSDLSWSKHISKISSKARKVAGLVYRKFYKHLATPALLKLYLSTVRPILEYCSSVWDPHLIKDIVLLERVQRFALRICLKDWHSDSDTLLQQADLPSLRNRRAFLKLCTLYKIINKLFVFQGDIIHFRSFDHIMQTRSRSSLLIHRPFARTNSFFTHLCPTLLHCGMVCLIIL